MKEKPILAIIVPCYNEEQVLPKTSGIFLGKIRELVNDGIVDGKSFVLFSDDGSTDATWEIVKELSAGNPAAKGISLSRNRGHQNALLAGMMEVKDMADVVVSIDCDGQQDINAIDGMLAKYANGCDIVYGVRKKRDTDSVFKRNTALAFYKLMKILGVEVIRNHADYRLVSSRALKALHEYREVNLFLRGLFPLLGFKTDVVHFDVRERLAGESHYPLAKMLNFALDGITSLSVKPLRMIAIVGMAMSFLSFVMIAYSVVVYLIGKVVPGWSSSVIVASLVGGIQLLSLGVIGEYVGKIYLEVKGRPRYIIAEKCGNGL